MIPTVFDFPSHLKKTLPERKPCMKRKLTEKNKGENEESTSIEINESSSRDVLEVLVEQRKKIKVLQQKIRRKEKKIIPLNDVLNDLNHLSIVNPLKLQLILW